MRDELKALSLSANALAKDLDVAVNRITAILRGQRGVTANTALRLARRFGMTPQVWLNLQETFELNRAEIESSREITQRVKPGARLPRLNLLASDTVRPLLTIDRSCFRLCRHCQTEGGSSA